MKRAWLGGVLVALVTLVVLATAGGALSTNPPNEGVCDNLDTGHLTAGDEIGRAHD